jgi:flagellar basal-body rod protein FlgG
MLEGMYSAAAGMAAQQQRLDALSNDVANASTIGYKRQRVAFRDLVYTASGPGGQQGVMEGAGAAATTIGRGGQGGAYQNTGAALDVAIEGDGYLQVRRPDGSTALTRNGQLSLDAQRNVLSNGLPLQPPVTLPAGVDQDKIAIGQDGKVTTDTGRAIGTINLFTVRSADRLTPIGDNLFITNQASGAATQAGNAVSLRQGVLETSDVDMGDVMADMMISQRAYSLASKAISTQDEMAQIANGVKK